VKDSAASRYGSTRSASTPYPADFASRIWDCVIRADKTTLQNVLMRMPDKVCAVAFATLTEEKRRSLYVLIAGPKTARIVEEIRLESRRRTSALVRGRILRTFLSYFGRAGKTGGTIYIRPRRGTSGPASGSEPPR
jgi:hypothetical protein